MLFGTQMQSQHTIAATVYVSSMESDVSHALCMVLATTGNLPLSLCVSFSYCQFLSLPVQFPTMPTLLNVQRQVYTSDRAILSKISPFFYFFHPKTLHFSHSPYVF